MAFDSRKASILSSLAGNSNDKSPKGSIDAPIVTLINLINSHPDYVTTSSCSGRISIFHHPSTQAASNSETVALRGDGVVLDEASEEDKDSEEGRGRWLLVEHSQITPTAAMINDLRNSLQALSGRVSLKHEPLVLHILCRSMKAASRLHTIAVGCGFRESGISMSSRTDKVMLAVRTMANSLETPLVVGGCCVVSLEYLGVLLKECNLKFRRNEMRKEMIQEKIMNELKNDLTQHDTTQQTTMQHDTTHRNATQHNTIQYEQSEGIIEYDTSSPELLEDLVVYGDGQYNTTQHNTDDLLSRWGHSCKLVHKKYCIVFGGYGVGPNKSHQRLNDVLILEAVFHDHNTTQHYTTLHNTTQHNATPQVGFKRLVPKVLNAPPSARVKHSMSATQHGCCVVFGGRQSPLKPLNDVWLIDYCTRTNTIQHNTTQHKDNELAPQPRWGHTASDGVFINGVETIVVFGGKDLTQEFNDTWFLSIQYNTTQHNTTQHEIESLKWSEPVISGSAPCKRSMHSCCVVSEGVLIYGGHSCNTILSSMHLLHIPQHNTTGLCWSTVDTMQQVPRFSHQMVPIDSESVLIIGGFCGTTQHNTTQQPRSSQYNPTQILDLKTKSLCCITTEPKTHHMLYRFTATAIKYNTTQHNNDKCVVLCLGGGLLCFSFGFCFNKSSCIVFPSKNKKNKKSDFAVLVENPAEIKKIKTSLEKYGIYDKNKSFP